MYGSIGIKILIGALLVFIILRIVGKKAISELTPFDLLYILVLSGLFEGAIYDERVTIFHAAFAMVLWGAVVYVVEILLSRTESVSKTIQGEPAVLVSEGKLNMKEIHDNRIDMEQLRAMLRQNGCYNLKDVSYAILEINGTLTVIKKEDKESPSILLIEEGRIDHDTLATIGKDEEWLRNELRNEGYFKVKDIIYCEWLPGDELHIYTDANAINEKIRIDG